MQVQRFNFEKLQDFKHPVPDIDDDLEIKEEEIVVAPPPPPTFSLMDLETAKRISFEEGRQAGLKEGHEQASSKEREQLKSVDQICSHFASEVGTIRDRHFQYMLEQSKELSALVMMICRKVAGDITSAIPSAGIEQMVHDCLAILTHQPRVNLVVHPDMANHMGEIIALKLKKANIECDVQVTGDTNLQSYEGRLEWKNGSIERHVDTIWSQVETKLKTVDFAELAHLKNEPVPSINQPSQPSAPLNINDSIDQMDDLAVLEAIAEENPASAADPTDTQEVRAAKVSDILQAIQAHKSASKSQEAQVTPAMPELLKPAEDDSGTPAIVISDEVVTVTPLESINTAPETGHAAEEAPKPKGRRSKVEDITPPTSDEGEDNG